MFSIKKMKLLKNVIKRFVPNSLYVFVYWKKLLPYFLFDSAKYIKNSNSFFLNNNEMKLRSDIIMRYHSLEKGITMPNRKIPFGLNVLSTLLGECIDYGKKYGYKDLQVVQATRILKEYYDIHDSYGYRFGEDIEKKLSEVFASFGIHQSTKQYSMSYLHYSDVRKLHFSLFSKSRISNRNYSAKEVHRDLIDAVIELSLSYPSACNRQPGRVHVIDGQENIAKVLSFQTGNRGFGQLANKLLIVTCDISGYSDPRERNLMWVDGGLFSMNILYALHYYGLAACPLNWAVKPHAEREVHKLCNIPSAERIILMISCGYPMDQFMQPISLRHELTNVIRYVK